MQASVKFEICTASGGKNLLAREREYPWEKDGKGDFP